jgi:hypothetical protein
MRQANIRSQKATSYRPSEGGKIKFHCQCQVENVENVFLSSLLQNVNKKEKSSSDELLHTHQEFFETFKFPFFVLEAQNCKRNSRFNLN